MKLSLLDALTEKMKWHQTRQQLLAENVANAETPGYRGRDLKAFSAEPSMRPLSTASVTTIATQPNHIVAASSSSVAFGAQAMNDFEVTPEGNGVTLEDEMMKVTSNQMDYQAVTTLYSRSLKILKTALGRTA